MEQYIRFGKHPPTISDWKSTNHRTKEKLPGMSVYRLYEDGVLETLRHGDGTYDAIADQFIEGKLRAWLVEGEELDETGSDGEPLITNVKIIKELKVGEFNDDQNILGENWYIKKLYSLKDDDSIREHQKLNGTFPKEGIVVADSESFVSRVRHSYAVVDKDAIDKRLVAERKQMMTDNFQTWGYPPGVYWMRKEQEERAKEMLTSAKTVLAKGDVP